MVNFYYHGSQHKLMTRGHLSLQREIRGSLGRNRIIKTVSGEVRVSVPDADEDEDERVDDISKPIPPGEPRESLQVQAKLAQIGSEMGFRIWVPRGDKNRILELLPIAYHDSFLNDLPLNYGRHDLGYHLPD